jgi:hypothetical protein
VPAEDPDHGADHDAEPELDAAHVDAAWRDIMANYGDRPAMPPAESAEPDDLPQRSYEPPEISEPAAEPEWWEREEHFTPPTPPPAPIPRTPRGLAWLGALGLPVVTIVLAVFRISIPGWAGTLGVLAFIASLGYLFATMPRDHDDPFDGNNGAVV